MYWRFALVLLLTGFSPALAVACSCSSAPPGQCAGLQAGDTVFLGTVTDAQVMPASSVPADVAATSPAAPGETPAPLASAAPIVRYHFRVEEKFAGTGDTEVDVFSGGDDGDCGYKFQKGERYVVYTQQEAEGRLFSTICNGTRPVADAAALIPQLRAMRDGSRVASVFGVLHRANPAFLSPPDDPDDPIPAISLKLRSHLDRFQTNSGPDGVYNFYDVHAGTYEFTANLPAGTELTQKTLNGPLPPFRIPEGACYEYNVDALPIGHIHGTVLGPDGKPLALASVELFRVGTYAEGRPGYWGFQGTKGAFDFDHVGPGEYILVYNRPNRMDPNSPFPRAFYPGVSDVNEAKPLVLKDGQNLQKVELKVSAGYPSHTVRAHVKWTGPRPIGSLTISAKADHWENPSAQKISDGEYQFTLFDEANYTISAWEDLKPQHIAVPGDKGTCAAPSRLVAEGISISGADASIKEITLVFPKPACAN